MAAAERSEYYCVEEAAPAAPKCESRKVTCSTPLPLLFPFSQRQRSLIQIASQFSASLAILSTQNSRQKKRCNYFFSHRLKIFHSFIWCLGVEKRRKFAQLPGTFSRSCLRERSRRDRKQAAGLLLTEEASAPSISHCSHYLAVVYPKFFVAC